MSKKGWILLGAGAGLKRWMKRRFALHFVPLTWLGEQLAALNYEDYRWSLPGAGSFGYTWAHRSVGPAGETL